MSGTLPYSMGELWLHGRWRYDAVRCLTAGLPSRAMPRIDYFLILQPHGAGSSTANTTIIRRL